LPSQQNKVQQMLLTQCSKLLLMLRVHLQFRQPTPALIEEAAMAAEAVAC
jgi:hypothetical protein